jgi:hypothetical protein
MSSKSPTLSFALISEMGSIASLPPSFHHLTFFFFLVGLGFELRALHLQSKCSVLETHFQTILLWLFWRWDLANYLPGLALNLDPPCISLPSN